MTHLSAWTGNLPEEVPRAGGHGARLLAVAQALGV
jgi:hypothetical protein